MTSQSDLEKWLASYRFPTVTMDLCVEGANYQTQVSLFPVRTKGDETTYLVNGEELPLKFSANGTYTMSKRVSNPIDASYRPECPTITLEGTLFLRTVYSFKEGSLQADLDQKNLITLLGLKSAGGRYPLMFIDMDSMEANSFGLNMGSLTSIFETLDAKKKAEILEKLSPAQQPAQVSVPYLQLNPKTSDKQVVWEVPKTIGSYLDQYIIGQAAAKKSIAVAFSNYMMRQQAKDTRMVMSHLLAIGPTGTGKTQTMRMLAKKAGVPFIETKLVGKSGEGYIGENLSLSLASLEEGEPYGIVFLDEIDKLARNRDLFGSMLQDELIGWLNEAKVKIEIGNGTNRQQKIIKTNNLLFVAAGAFTDTYRPLTDIIRSRIGKCSDTEALAAVIPQDIINYGIKSELVGRMPALATFNPLSVTDLQQIIMNTDSPFTQHVSTLKLRGYEVRFATDFPEYLSQCCPLETGARTLGTIAHELFTDITYDPESFSKDNIIMIDAAVGEKLIRTRPTQKRKGIGFAAADTT